jgi:hypothetical protein|tara:strand:+ start:624 stop:875 length:252 start_codon:yes stop_codon:yes gene_type:complete
MKKTAVLLIALGLLSGCSKGQIAASNGSPNLTWVGCHKVTNSPSKGSYAYWLLGDLAVGDNIFFKQHSNDGTVGKVVTAIPCK